MLGNFISRPNTQVLLTQLTLKLLYDPVVVHELEQLGVKIVAGEDINYATKTLSNKVVKDILELDETWQLLDQFVNQVLSDPKVESALQKAFVQSVHFALVSKPEVRGQRLQKSDLQQHQIHQQQREEGSPHEKENVQKIESGEKKGELLTVPPQFIDKTIQILFREAFESASLVGLQYTEEGLEKKKKVFESELLWRREKLGAPLRRKFVKFIREHFDEVFVQDQELVDGGADTLILQQILKIDTKVSDYKEYLAHLEKQDRGILWDTYSKKQVEEIDNKKKIIEELEKAKHDKTALLRKELESIVLNPVKAFPSESITEYLGEHYPNVHLVTKGHNMNE